MSTMYDVIVVGAGSMGMSAGYELAHRGLRTLLIDAYDPPHIHGSHHGETRLIRHAYHGGAGYVKMALRADERWLELEQLTGMKLLERSGVLNISDPDIYSYTQRLGYSEAHGVSVELMRSPDIRRRWSQIRVPYSFEAMYEPNAGYLYSERCIAAYKQLAVAAGASIVPNTFVLDIKANGSSINVHTQHDKYEASHVIVTAGAWFKRLSSFVDLPIQAVRKVVAWFETNHSDFDAGVFPGFTLGTREGGYYGFPNIAGAGLKIGRHDTGVEWQPGQELERFGAYPEDERDLRRVLDAYMPGAAGRLLKGTVCKYEMTPDDNFIIDRHPDHSNVWMAGGFSGHGFKFASVVGEILADLVESGHSEQDLSLFQLSRFASK